MLLIIFLKDSINKSLRRYFVLLLYNSMIKYFYIFALFISASASAQTVTNIYWTTQSELPVNQTIYYNRSIPLIWSDFQGKPELTGDVAALTMSGFGYKASMKSVNQSSSLDISVYCYFSKPKSWVKPDRNTDYILSHEQHHFDITYLVATMFVEKLKQQNLTASNANSLLPKIYKECCDLMGKMQDEYDDQTNHGQRKDMQLRWHDTITKRLAAISSQ